MKLAFAWKFHLFAIKTEGGDWLDGNVLQLQSSIQWKKKSYCSIIMCYFKHLICIALIAMTLCELLKLIASMVWVIDTLICWKSTRKMAFDLKSAFYLVKYPIVQNSSEKAARYAFKDAQKIEFCISLNWYFMQIERKHFQSIAYFFSTCI